MFFPRSAQYPNCSRYLRQSLPGVVRVPRIAIAMQEIAGLDAKQFAQALLPGAMPTLVPSDTPPFSFPAVLGPSWKVARDGSNRIALDVRLFDDFEAGFGPTLMTQAHVSAKPGTPGAREFNGRFDSRGIIETMGGGAPRPGSDARSIGYYREADVFRFGVCVLGALVDWALVRQGRPSAGAADRFAAHAYRSVAIY